MVFLLYAIFLALAAVAVGFGAWPFLPARGQARLPRLLMAASVASLMLGIGLGTYMELGSPGLALRTLTGPRDNDYPALVAELARHMREHPQDPKGWMLLAKGYADLGDQGSSMLAFQKGITLMVAGLESRLKANPDDPDGWQRLVRAYAVMGRKDKSKASLAEARRALAANSAALVALDQEEKELKLN